MLLDFSHTNCSINRETVCGREGNRQKDIEREKRDRETNTHTHTNGKKRKDKTDKLADRLTL